MLLSNKRVNDCMYGIQSMEIGIHATDDSKGIPVHGK